MSTLDTITAVLGWCSLINISILCFVALILSFMRGFVIKIHSALLSLSEEDLCRAYFQYLAQYKLLVIVFNLVPYFALKLI